LLSVSAFKPMIDKILTEAGFAAGPDALTSLTSALAQRKAEVTAEAPASTGELPPSALVGTITGQFGGVGSKP
jgi:flotillin